MKPSPTRSFAQGVFHNWKPDRLFVHLTAYIDESGTHNGSPVTIMAGWIGKAGRWHQFDQRWNRLLSKQGLSYVHAKDLAQGSRLFKDHNDWPHDRRNKLFHRFGRLAFRHALFGLTITLRNNDYDQVYKSPLKREPKKLQLSTAYGICFQYFINSTFLHLSELGLNDNLNINFIFEDGHRHADNALQMYQTGFRKYAPKERVEAVKGVSFLNKREFPALQAADFLAYRAFQVEDKGRFEASRGHPSHVGCPTIPEAGEDAPLYRIALSIHDLEKMRDDVLREDDRRIEWGRRRTEEIMARKISSEEPIS